MPNRVKTPALSAVLLIIHASLLLLSSRLQFPTRDEVAHVPAGLSYWYTGEFKLYNVNPPLGKLLATVPTLLLNPQVNGIELPITPGQRVEWEVARQFAYDNRLNYFDLIWSARLAGILWSVFGGILIYRWSAELYGQRGGLLALALWCFDPNVLAHAPLVTPDIPATVIGLAATYTFWRYLRTGTWSLASAAGVLLGAAQLTKFTMLALYGVWPVLAVARSLARSSTAFQTLSVRVRLLQGGAIMLFSVWTINMGYGFDGTFTRLGEYEFVSGTFTGQALDEPGIGNRFRGVWLGAIPVPTPYDYLTGIDVQQRDLEGVNMPPSYLAGEWRRGGWWYYYLYGLAIKVPLGTSGLAVWGFVLAVRRSDLSAGWVDELAVWLPAVTILALASSQTGFSHHFRYVLPTVPFICVACAKLVGYVHRRTQVPGLGVLALFGWSVASSISVYPHSLSYFNESVGGPDHGHEYLINSNIDWGQDLYFFKMWADEHTYAHPIGLAYHSSIDYRAVGIYYERIPLEPAPGWFAVDIWNLMNPAGQYGYFRSFTPVTKAGYSIFIYHITPEDVKRVREEMSVTPPPNQPIANLRRPVQRKP